MTTLPIRRTIATLKLPAQVAVLISLAGTIVTRLTGNAGFPSPEPTLAVIQTAIGELETAEAAAQARTKGAVSLRNEKRKALILLLVELKAYVQKQADAVDPEHAAALIESAGMGVKKPHARPKRVFGVKPGAVSGSVVVSTAVAARRASYDWELSADGGKTWQAVPSTLRSETSITGLQPGTSYLFRSRGVTKAGPSDWTTPIPLLVK